MLKKLFIKALMMGFVFAGLSLYAGYLITGRLPSFTDRLSGLLPAAGASRDKASSWSDIGALEHKSRAQDDSYQVMQGGKTVIYKWQDAQGRWHYGERAPAGVAAAREEIAVPASSAPQPVARASQQSAPTEDALVNPYSPGGAKELIDRAKAVRQQVEERSHEQQARLDET